MAFTNNLIFLFFFSLFHSRMWINYLATIVPLPHYQVAMNTENVESSLSIREDPSARDRAYGNLDYTYLIVRDGFYNDPRYIFYKQPVYKKH